MTRALDRRKFIGLLAAGVAGLAAGSACAHSESATARDSYVRTVKASFDDVFADLEFAITERNYRITGVNSIGRAIVDRQDQKSPFPLASVVHFCNIEAAREILEINLDYLLLMPCRIALNEIDDGHIRIEAQLLPLDDEPLHAVAVRVNAMLRSIVDFAAGDW